MWSNTFAQKPEYKLEGIDYDQNGNLQHLKRYAAPINSSTAHLLDNLTYLSNQKNEIPFALLRSDPLLAPVSDDPA